MSSKAMKIVGVTLMSIGAAVVLILLAVGITHGLVGLDFAAVHDINVLIPTSLGAGALSFLGGMFTLMMRDFKEQL